MAFGGVDCVNTISEPTGSDERYLLDESVALYFFLNKIYCSRVLGKGHYSVNLYIK